MSGVTSAIAPQSITADKMAAGAVLEALPDGSLTPGKLNGGQAGNAPAYACRAWVLFDGTGTVNILASGNVTSVTDNGTGDYTVNFQTAMPTSFYCVAIGSKNRAASKSVNNNLGLHDIPSMLSGSVRLSSVYASSSGTLDMGHLSVCIFA